MSQVIRRIVVAASLALALLLAVPAPSHAAQARKPAQKVEIGLMAQVWSWLEGWVGLKSATPPPQPRKDVMTTPAPLPPPPEQGPAIDPNGVK
ncbi:MAG: hypothetical protein ACJ76N_19690 [Thermoanaerobaculia bacterium]